jgi:hypothetical protein
MTKSALRAEGLASIVTSRVTGASSFHSIDPQALSNDHVGKGRGGGSIFPPAASSKEGLVAVREKKLRKNGEDVAKAETWLSR